MTDNTPNDVQTRLRELADEARRTASRSEPLLREALGIIEQLQRERDDAAQHATARLQALREAETEHRLDMDSVRQRFIEALGPLNAEIEAMTAALADPACPWAGLTISYIDDVGLAFDFVPITEFYKDLNSPDLQAGGSSAGSPRTPAARECVSSPQCDYAGGPLRSPLTEAPTGSPAPFSSHTNTKPVGSELT